jgi:hypothetical protein
VKHLAIALLLLPSIAFAEEPEAEGPHHLAVVVAGTRVLEGEEPTALTLGGDYEYHPARRHLGLGAVAEYAMGEVATTTVLGVADIHLWHGLTIQTGLGFERARAELHPCARIGVMYELEVAHFTIAPQLHEDFSAESAIVAGVAVGHAF